MKFRYTPPKSAEATTIDLLGYSDVDVIAREIRERSLFFEIGLLEHIYLSVAGRGVFLDVGANIGNHSVFFAKFCADHVLAVEPNPKVLPLLRRNLKTNAPGRHTVFPFAVAARPGVGHMTVRPNFETNIGGSQVEILSSVTVDRIDTIQVTTLDALLPQSAPLLAKYPLTLVKIDVEGMECEVLKGAHNLLTCHRPHLVIELATEDARASMRSFLRDRGYHDSGRRFGWTPTYHFVDPSFHYLAPYEAPPHSDPEVDLLCQVGDEILALVPEGQTYILVDEDRWWAGLVADGRRRLPFLERDGLYWGPPENDLTAISELVRLKQSGARFILFAEPAFWWLDHYHGLANHLREHTEQVLETPLLRGYVL
jgi:FkbM family methyltransferase